jgi:hypothetical protein
MASSERQATLVSMRSIRRPQASYCTRRGGSASAASPRRAEVGNGTRAEPVELRLDGFGDRGRQAARDQTTQQIVALVGVAERGWALKELHSHILLQPRDGGPTATGPGRKAGLG